VAPVPPLVAEATKKSGLLWIAIRGQPRRFAVWHVWRDDSAYIVTGPGEQPAPALAEAAICDVTVRSTDKGGRIVTWRAVVSRVEPDSDAWKEVVPALLAGRLNLTGASDAEQRWAAECHVLRLAPTGELVEAGDTLPTGSLAAPPPPSPARTTSRIPFTLGGRRRRQAGSSDGHR